MKPISIPGFGILDLDHLVVDYNGTLAEDGILIPGVGEHIHALSRELSLHIITADTFGTVQQAVAGMPCSVHILSREKQARQKASYISTLNPESVASIGNGRNDALMLQDAALGIAVIQKEGASREAIEAADIICPDILSALELLLTPHRLMATLRA